ILQDIATSIVSRISVGYRVQEWKTSKDAQGQRVKTATRWQPAEISLTALAADPNARTRSRSMPEVTISDQIRAAAGLLGITGNLVDQLATRDGVTIEAARSELLAHLRETQPHIDGRASVERDEHEKLISRCANALAHHINPSIALRQESRP